MASQKFLHLSLTSPQLALRASFEAHELTEFRRALRNGAGVNVRDRDATYSIFEQACRTPGKKDFIKACIYHGALVAEENPVSKEYPIHIAALSFDSENLSVLLETDRLYVDQKYEDRTALYLLCEQISADNWQSVFECLKLLLKYQANINATNEANVSPIALLASGSDPWRRTVVEYCLNNYSVNVDLRRGQARKAIEKNFPNLHIPAYDMETVTVEILRSRLSAGTEDGFLEEYEKFCTQSGEQGMREDDRKELLAVAVHRAKLQAAKKLVETQLEGGKFIGPSKLLSGLLANCCIRGNVRVLEWLLEIIPAHAVALVNEDPLLSMLVKEIDVYKDKNKCPFFRSMGILLNDPRIEIDKIDVKQFSALHYAVKFKIDHAQELLLAKGAYVGGEDLYGELPISDMDPFLLEKHLDSCVSSNERKPGDEDYELKFDFSNFVPPKHKPNASEPVGKSVSALPYEDEMLPIVRMAQSSDNKRLLRHPVISSILLMKWYKLSIFFYLNLLVCTIFFVSFIFFVVFCYGRDDAPFKVLFRGLSLVGLVYLILRELIQFLLNMRVYVRSAENYMELLLIFASSTVLIYEFGTETRRVASACVILLSALEFTLLVGTLPVLSISTHMVMLKTVSKNFLKCLVLYSIILLSFAFSFYTLFRVSDNGNATATGAPTTQDKADDGEDDQFNQFGEIPLALMKTAVMLTGEFEAANIKFQQSSLSYIIFALFLFFVSIVLFNLMNGLAVSDTTTIKAESELIGIVQKVFVIYKYENALKTSKPIRFIMDWLSCLFSSNSLQLFPNLVPLKYITIKPNQSNAILIKSLVERQASNNLEKGDVELGKYSEAERLLYRTDKFGNECCIMPCLRYNMDGKIVKYALEILHSRQENVGSIEYRVSRIEQNIDRLLQEQIEMRKIMQGIAEVLQKAKM
ncbi:transient receptor potential cation channel protein painless [Anopheles ziemanni]|uniref:transient receptor potential cation channel protein painless n=1 Tax=Anopheles coustani TaxID=139045 RepID=UPI002658FE06|nr:transient receptor potential cation channel protein painless [Anopheles coustani]XP_058169500.1 transient receptor potential cation channel protein painless [Anopheles ziemanni]